MSQIHLGGTLVEIPTLPSYSGGASLTSMTLNASGETFHMCGSVYFAGGYSATPKTISAAGGGKIIWLSAAVTFANAGTTFKVGIQDLSTASNPAQGDGTFDVLASFAGGGGGITANAVQSSTMTSGSKSIAHGQELAITFEMTAMAGADFIILRYGSPARGSGSFAMPMCSDNTGGSYARTAAGYPMAVIQFDDGTLATIFRSYFVTSTSSTVSYALDTATADEYANIFTFPYPVKVIGCTINAQNATSISADAEVLLYSDPLVTPVAQRTYTLDGTIGPVAASNAQRDVIFSSPYYVNASSPFAVSLRPTVNAQNMLMYFNDFPSLAVANLFGFGDYCYAARRLDNAGAFGGYNGGTAKTRYAYIALLIDSIGQDSHFAHSQIGM